MQINIYLHPRVYIQHLQPDLQTAQKVEHGVTIKWGRASGMSAWSACTPPVSSSTSSATSASLSPSINSSNAPHSPNHRFWTNVLSSRYLPWCLGTRCSQYVSRRCAVLENTSDYFFSASRSRRVFHQFFQLVSSHRYFQVRYQWNNTNLYRRECSPDLLWLW